MNILSYLIAFLLGCLISSLTYITYLKFKEDKNYKKDLSELFNREVLIQKAQYENRKVAYENNSEIQLDINKIKKDKENNIVNKILEERKLIQSVNSYKEIIKENEIC